MKNKEKERILKLKNSLTGQINNINLSYSKKVNLYLCGPTVYDKVHIGNMRPSIIFDVILRLLKKINIDYKYVQNITDIDDKIIEKSEKEGLEEKLISSLYEKLYKENFKNLNLLNPDFHLITENIEIIINFIEELYKSKNAYILKENMLFNIEKNKNEYGKISNQILENLSNMGRKIKNLEKKDEKDFVIWKKTSKGIKWNSQWFKGRPGWHTECVALIDKLFNKETIDIHGGGKDLLFPHHENERIQYWAINKKELSKIWIHFGHVIVKKEKMSKSLGNYLSVEYFISNYGANAMKILLLNSRYGDDIEVNEPIIKQSTSQSKKIENLFKKIKYLFYSKKIKRKNIPNKKKIKEEVINALLNNLDLKKVIFDLENLIYEINIEIKKEDHWDKEKTLIWIDDFLFITEIMGFELGELYYNKKEEKMIEEWKKLISIKEFKKSDKIRDDLKKMNII